MERHPNIARILNHTPDRQYRADLTVLQRHLGGDGGHRAPAFIITLRTYMTELEASKTRKDAWSLDPSRPVPIVAWNVPMMNTDMQLPKLLPRHLGLTNDQFIRFKQAVNDYDWAEVTGQWNDFSHGEVGTTFKYNLDKLEKWLGWTLRHPVSETLTGSATSISI